MRLFTAPPPSVSNKTTREEVGSDLTSHPMGTVLGSILHTLLGKPVMPLSSGFPTKNPISLCFQQPSKWCPQLSTLYWDKGKYMLPGQLFRMFTASLFCVTLTVSSNLLIFQSALWFKSRAMQKDYCTEDLIKQINNNPHLSQPFWLLNTSILGQGRSLQTS